jgi:lysophospholipase L1-like esterase
MTNNVCSRRKLSRAAAAVVAAATLVVGLGGGPASAGDRGSRDRARYVALGDSVAFGYSPLLEDPWVPDRFVGYPELIAQRTHLGTTNLACPGQTAQGIVSRDVVNDGCFDFRDAAAQEGITVLHADYRGTQLRAALDAVRSDAPPWLISIQGGGNELSNCAERRDPDACLRRALPKINDSLELAVNRLRAAGSRARIALVGYHLVPGLEAPLRQVNRVVARAARDTDVEFVDVAEPFAEYARRHNGDLCSTGLLVALPDGSCDLHPTATGQRLYADAVLDAVRDRDRREHHDHERHEHNDDDDS